MGRLGLAALVVEAHRDGLRDAALLHRHAIDRAGRRDGALVVRDDDELGLADELPEEVREAADVRLVQRRVQLVEQAERRGLDHVEREQQRHGREGLLAAGEQRDALELRAGGLRDDLDAALQDVLGDDELERRPAAAEEGLEGVREVLLDLLEGLLLDQRHLILPMQKNY